MFCTKEGVERRKGVTVCMISMMYQMKTSAKAFVTHCTIAVWAMNGMVAVKLIQLQLPTGVDKVALIASIYHTSRLRMISMMYQMKTSAKVFVTMAVWAMNGMVAVKLIQLQLHTEVDKVALNAIFGQVTIIMHFCRSHD